MTIGGAMNGATVLRRLLRHTAPVTVRDLMRTDVVGVLVIDPLAPLTETADLLAGTVLGAALEATTERDAVAANAFAGTVATPSGGRPQIAPGSTVVRSVPTVGGETRRSVRRHEAPDRSDPQPAMRSAHADPHGSARAAAPPLGSSPAEPAVAAGRPTAARSSASPVARSPRPAIAGSSGWTDRAVAVAASTPLDTGAAARRAAPAGTSTNRPTGAGPDPGASEWTPIGRAVVTPLPEEAADAVHVGRATSSPSIHAGAPVASPPPSSPTGRHDTPPASRRAGTTAGSQLAGLARWWDESHASPEPQPRDVGAPSTTVQPVRTAGAPPRGQMAGAAVATDPPRAVGGDVRSVFGALLEELLLSEARADGIEVWP